MKPKKAEAAAVGSGMLMCGGCRRVTKVLTNDLCGRERRRQASEAQHAAIPEKSRSRPSAKVMPKIRLSSEAEMGNSSSGNLPGRP
jgi:hypothetical protein